MKDITGNFFSVNVSNYYVFASKSHTGRYFENTETRVATDHLFISHLLGQATTKTEKLDRVTDQQVFDPKKGNLKHLKFI